MDDTRERNTCLFCGSQDVLLPWVGISMGMCGFNYSFCRKCLEGMTGSEFWEAFFVIAGYAWPPRLDADAQEVFDKDGGPEEVCLPVVGGGKDREPRKLTRAEKERRKLTNALRYKILRRDEFRCVLCGATSADEGLEVDHIIPVARKGKTTPDNLRTLCHTCNSGKGTKLDTETGC